MKLNKNTALKLIRKYAPGLDNIRRNSIIVTKKIKVNNCIFLKVSIFEWHIENRELVLYEYKTTFKELDDKFKGFIQMNIVYERDGSPYDKISYLLNECGEINCEVLVNYGEK